MNLAPLQSAQESLKLSIAVQAMMHTSESAERALLHSTPLPAPSEAYEYLHLPSGYQTLPNLLPAI